MRRTATFQAGDPVGVGRFNDLAEDPSDRLRAFLSFEECLRASGGLARPVNSLRKDPNPCPHAPQDSRIGEVVEASSTGFSAECYTLYGAPPLGALVRVGEPCRVWRCVQRVDRRALDPGRRVAARGAGEPDEASVYRNNPQIARLLATHMEALVMGHDRAGGHRAAAARRAAAHPRLCVLLRRCRRAGLHGATRLPAFARDRERACHRRGDCRERPACCRGARGWGRLPAASGSRTRGGACQRCHAVERDSAGHPMTVDGTRPDDAPSSGGETLRDPSGQALRVPSGQALRKAQGERRTVNGSRRSTPRRGCRRVLG